MNDKYDLKNMNSGYLFQHGYSVVWDELKKQKYPWEAIPLIKSYVDALVQSLDKNEYIEYPENVFIHKTAVAAPSVYFGSSIIIGANTEIRHNAYIRSNVIVGENAVIGNSTELKNAILFDKVQVPHFNYVGDSILGYKAHLGAGAITSNVKSDSSFISVVCGDKKIKTGLLKFGAILGDNVEVGCNAVLNPGTVIGANSNIYPLSMVRGFVPGGSIYKKQNEITEKR